MLHIGGEASTVRFAHSARGSVDIHFYALGGEMPPRAGTCSLTLEALQFPAHARRAGTVEEPTEALSL